MQPLRHSPERALTRPAMVLLAWRRWLAPRPFDWVLSFLYCAVLLNFILSSCSCDFSWLEVLGLGGALATLGLIDRWEYWRYEASTPIRVAVLLFAVRVGLVEAVAQIDQFDLSPFLYVLLPYTAAVAFGINAGWWIGGAIWVRYFAQLVDNGAGWAGVQANSNMLLVFSVGIIFVLAMAKLMLQERAGHARTEQLLAELERSHQQLTAYAEQVAELATASERNRLARDIHDSLGHYLTVINVQLEKALVFRSKDAQVADHAVANAKRMAREALDDVRRSVGMLRTTQGLFSVRRALRRLAGQVQSEHLTLMLTLDEDDSRVSLQGQMALYRAAQEGLTNVQRHAQARRVQVSFHVGLQEARLTIVDDGVGFAFDHCATQAVTGPGGNGLQGIRERLALVGGALQIKAETGRGTTLIAVVPCAPLAQHRSILEVV